MRLSVVGVVANLVDGGFDSSDGEEFRELSRVVAFLNSKQVESAAVL